MCLTTTKEINFVEPPPPIFFITSEYYLDGVLLGHVDINGQVLEVLGQSSSGPLDRNNSRFHGSSYSLGDRNQLKSINFLHFSSEKKTVSKLKISTRNREDIDPVIESTKISNFKICVKMSSICTT